MKLKVIVHEAEEGGYWAEVPGIPGCVTQGENYDNLIANIYEAVESDPGATMVSPRAAAAAPRPVTAPPPTPQAYAGQVPTGQPPEVAPPKKINPVPIAIGVGVFLLICVCIAFLVWVDQTYRWCVFFPFIPGCG